MIFISAKWEPGMDAPKITSCCQYEGIKRSGVDMAEEVKDTRYEHDVAGVKVFEILSIRNGLSLNANFVIDTEDKEQASDAVLQLIDG